MDNLFSTHPSTENRIAALREMSVDGMNPSESVGEGPFAEAPARRPSIIPNTGPRDGRDGAPKGPWS
jgi:heat shock protein HtpX